MKQSTPISITPKPDCKTCHGNGLISVGHAPAPFGHVYVSLPEEFCDCVVQQLPPETPEMDVEDWEIFLHFPEPDNGMRFTWTYGPESKNTIFINDNNLPNPKERGIAAIVCHQIGTPEAERLAMAFCRALAMLQLLEEIAPVIEEEAERRESAPHAARQADYWSEMREAHNKMRVEIARAHGVDPPEPAPPVEDEDDEDDYDYAADDRNFDADRERRFFGK